MKPVLLLLLLLLCVTKLLLLCLASSAGQALSDAATVYQWEILILWLDSGM